MFHPNPMKLLPSQFVNGILVGIFMYLGMTIGTDKQKVVASVSATVREKQNVVSLQRTEQSIGVEPLWGNQNSTQTTSVACIFQ